MNVSRWSRGRPRTIRRVWRAVGLVLWTLIVLLVVLMVAATVSPRGLATLRTDIANGWTAFVANPPWLLVLAPSREPGQAPDLTVQLFNGGTFHLADQRGKVVVVNFWASWCPPCRAEAPRFATAWRMYGNRGVTFVGVDLDDTPANAQAFLREFGISYANGPDQTLTITEAYGVTGLPATIIVDRQGRIRERWQGEIQADQLSAFIEDALR